MATNLTFDEKQARLAHVLPYLVQAKHKNKLLSVLAEEKRVGQKLYEDVLLVDNSRIRILKEDKSPFSGFFINGHVNFCKPASFVMRSLGKGEYSVPSSAFYKTKETKSKSKIFQDKESGNVFSRLPNGLYIKKSSKKETVPLLPCIVEVRPTSLFYSFHSNCQPCPTGALITPYPPQLCSLLRQELEKKNPSEDAHLRISMTIEQSKKALINGEHYGFLFSELFFTVDELFEKVTTVSHNQSDDQNDVLLDLHFLTCLSPSMDTFEKISQYIKGKKISSSFPTFFIVVCFSSSTPIEHSKLPLSLMQQAQKLIFVELKQDDFEPWYEKRNAGTDDQLQRSKLITMQL